jgi:hypothetical protein
MQLRAALELAELSERRGKIDVTTEYLGRADLSCDLDTSLDIRQTSPVAKLHRGNAEDVQRPRPHLVGAELLRHGERSLGKADCPGVFVAEHGEPRELAEDKRLRPRGLNAFDQHGRLLFPRRR